MFQRARTRLAEIRTALRLGLIIAVLILFIIFLLQNTDQTHVKFLFFEEDVPTIIVILVTTLGGFAVGYLLGMRSRRRRKQQAQTE